MKLGGSRTSERRLLPGGRLSGPMPWVIAIMLFLTVLATAAGLGIGRAAAAMGGAIAGKVTIQIIEANPDRRAVQQRAIVTQLQRLTNVTSVSPVPDPAVRDLLAPWLGEQGLDDSIPLPALIDVTLREASPAAIADLAAAVHGVAPAARIDRHADWLGPIGGLLTTLQWLSVGLVAATAAATAATVVLGARAALDQHRATIDVMHLMGASDRQIAAMFERGVALDALSGCALGFVSAVGVLFLVGGRVQSVGAALLDDSGLGWAGWVAIALLPIAGVALSIVTARVTVLRALGRIL